MDDYGSFQSANGQPIMVSANGDEDVPLLRNNQMTNSESSSSRESSSSTKSRRIRASLLVGMALWMVVMAAELSPFLFLVSTDEHQSVGGSTYDDDEYDDDDDALHAMWGSTAFNIRMCSIEECLESPCGDPQAAPFVCLALEHDTKIRGGCGRTPWAFEICSDQCDASGCSLLLERAEIANAAAAAADSSSGGHHHQHLRGSEDCSTDCTRDWCRKNRLCGDGENAPYQCTAGLYAFGCSSDKFEWTLRSTGEECSSCCKTTSCDD